MSTEIETKVLVNVYSEEGCDIADGEYSINIGGIIGPFDLTEHGGESDYHLLKTAVDEWISENLDQLRVFEETNTSIMLTKKIEQQDVFFMKFFVVDSYENY